MKFNIPCRSIPMPYYVGHREPSYKDMPLTFKCVSGSCTIAFPLYRAVTSEQSSSIWGSRLSSLYYKRPGVDSDWVNWKTMNCSAVSLSEGQEFQISGLNGGALNEPYPGYANIFKVTGQNSNTEVHLYGNLSSLYAPEVTSIQFCNMFENRFNYNLTDASKCVVPYIGNGATEAMNAFGYQKKMKVAPIFPNATFVSNSFNWGFQECSVLSAIEVGFIQTSNWSFSNWFKNTQNSSGIFIKPQATYIPSRSADTILSNWTVLNRIDGKLYYAQQGDGTNVPYEGEDPYAWYYN